MKNSTDRAIQICLRTWTAASRTTRTRPSPTVGAPSATTTAASTTAATGTATARATARGGRATSTSTAATASGRRASARAPGLRVQRAQGPRRPAARGEQLGHLGHRGRRRLLRGAERDRRVRGRVHGRGGRRALRLHVLRGRRRQPDDGRGRGRRRHLLGGPCERGAAPGGVGRLLRIRVRTLRRWAPGPRLRRRGRLLLTHGAEIATIWRDRQRAGTPSAAARRAGSASKKSAREQRRRPRRARRGGGWMDRQRVTELESERPPNNEGNDERVA